MASKRVLIDSGVEEFKPSNFGEALKEWRESFDKRGNLVIDPPKFLKTKVVVSWKLYSRPYISRRRV